MSWGRKKHAWSAIWHVATMKNSSSFWTPAAQFDLCLAAAGSTALTRADRTLWATTPAVFSEQLRCVFPNIYYTMTIISPTCRCRGPSITKNSFFNQINACLWSENFINWPFVYFWRFSFTIVFDVIDKKKVNLSLHRSLSGKEIWPGFQQVLLFVKSV